jgi:hypothetical protein
LVVEIEIGRWEPDKQRQTGEDAEMEKESQNGWERKRHMIIWRSSIAFKGYRYK